MGRCRSSLLGPHSQSFSITSDTNNRFSFLLVPRSFVSRFVDLNQIESVRMGLEKQVFGDRAVGKTTSHRNWNSHDVRFL